MTIDRVFVIQWPRQPDTMERTNPPSRFWVQTQEELEAIRDTHAAYQANNSLFGAVLVVATPEEWAQMLLRVVAEIAEPWRLYMRPLPHLNRKDLPIIQPDAASGDWREATTEETHAYIERKAKQRAYELRTVEVPVPGHPPADVTRRGKK